MDLLKGLISKKKKEIKNKKTTILKDEIDKKRNLTKQKEEAELRQIKLEKREMSINAIQQIKEEVKIKSSEFTVPTNNIFMNPFYNLCINHKMRQINKKEN